LENLLIFVKYEDQIMKLTSNWSRGNLFWRTFTKDDTVYIVGLRDGFLSNGGSITYENPTGFFQMEIKRGDIFGRTLIAAGHVFKNDDEFIITEDGSLIEIADAANVTIDNGFKFEFYGEVTQFLSAGAADSTIKITSSLTQVTNVNNTHQTTLNNQATNETGVQVGGEATASGKVNDIQIGVKVNGNISNKVTNKIEQIVTNTLGVQLSTTTSYSEEQSITIKAGKLTVVTSSWQRRFVTGIVTVGHDTFQYDATLGYITSRRISEYASPNDLPPELMAAYRIQNPGFKPPLNLADSSVLREISNPKVYVIFGGAKFWIPDPDVLQRLYGGWGSVVVVSDNALNDVPTTPRNNTILREENDAFVWLFENGKRRHITTPLVLNRFGGWGAVHVVPDKAISEFPIGEPIA
jgi:hypothetical protein